MKITKEEKLKLSRWAMKLNCELTDNEMIKYFPNEVITRIKNNCAQIERDASVRKISKFKNELDSFGTKVQKILENL